MIPIGMAEAESLDLPGPEYPNSPLTNVVFEIRFPGEPAIECHRDQFFAVARDEFPSVYVPKLQPGEAVALSPYHFRRSDGSALLTALNLFAYNTVTYPGFDRFRVEVLRWISVFAEQFKIGKLTRTGLRYINVVRYPPTEQFPVSSFFDVTVKLGMMESAAFNKFALSAVIPTSSGGQLTVQIHEVPDGNGEPAIVLDFDYAMAGDLHVSRIEEYLDNSHAETKRLFEGLLTDKYRNFLRGEGLE
jgi:uncharacterized protein (TIGR04255 family)